MGCLNSKPAGEDEGKQEAEAGSLGGDSDELNAHRSSQRGSSKGKPKKPAEDDYAARGGTLSKRVSKHRIRRLSYLGERGDGGDEDEGPRMPAEVDGQKAPVGPMKALKEDEVGDPGLGAQKKTRRRRLSTTQNQDSDGGGEALDPERRRVLLDHSPMEVMVDGTRLHVSSAMISVPGHEPCYKKSNQDSAFVLHHFDHNAALFGVFDGHGPRGHYASAFVRDTLPGIIEQKLQEGDITAALEKSFVEMHEELNQSVVNAEYSGTTAVVSHLSGKHLISAWAGDSRGVIAREHDGQLEAMELTTDHKPENKAEKKRILDSNGRVAKLTDEYGDEVGPYRVWLSYAWTPGLAMSRSLGDNVAHKAGVIPNPDVRVHTIHPSDRFFILATDGVWEFISSEEAVSIVAKSYSPEEACEALAKSARKRWITEEEGVVDDITIVVVAFREG